MAKKPSSIITYTEILSRAAHNIEQEIHEWREKAEIRGLAVDVLAGVIQPLEEKLDAIKTIYKIETGVDCS